MQTLTIKRAEAPSSIAVFGQDDLLSLSFEQTVNNGAPAAASITYGYDDPALVPSSSMFEWSDGYQRAIRKGDTFVIDDDGTRYTGRISSISVGEHEIKLEAIDLVYQLGGIGHTYFRDHYANYDEVYSYLGINENDEIEVSVPMDMNPVSNMVVFGKEGGGEHQEIPINTPVLKHTFDMTGGNMATDKYMAVYVVRTEIPNLPDTVSVNEMTFKVRMEGGSKVVVAMVSLWNTSGTKLSQTTWEMTTPSSGYLDKTLSTKGGNGSIDRGDFNLSSTLSPGASVYITIEVATRPAGGMGGTDPVDFYIFGGDSSYPTYNHSIKFRTLHEEFQTAYDPWLGMWMTNLDTSGVERYQSTSDPFISFGYKMYPPYGSPYNVTSFFDTGRVYEGSKIYIIEDVAGLTTLDENTLLLGTSVAGVKIGGYSGDISKTSVFQGIAGGNDISVGFTGGALSNPRRFSYMRCAGGSLLEYFTTLADAIDPSGRNNTLYSSGDALRVGVRKSLYMDPAGRTLDMTTPGHKVREFRPQKNLSYKQVTSVIKGSDPTYGKLPVVICMTDKAALDEQGGLNNSKMLSGSGSSVADMSQALYADLVNNVSKDWTATVVLSGIDYGFYITSGDYNGSGEVVAVTHPSLGLTDYKMVVRSVHYDYPSNTTTLNLNSYPTEYMNKLVTMDQMILVDNATRFDISGDTEVAQSIYLMKKVSSLPSISSASVTYAGGTENAGKVIRTQLPHMDSLLVTAVFPPMYKQIDKYGITSVSVAGHSFSLGTYKRPDWFNHQTLSVNVLFYR